MEEGISNSLESSLTLSLCAFRNRVELVPEGKERSVRGIVKLPVAETLAPMLNISRLTASSAKPSERNSKLAKHQKRRTGSHWEKVRLQVGEDKRECSMSELHSIDRSLSKISIRDDKIGPNVRVCRLGSPVKKRMLTREIKMIVPSDMTF
jgi:hypothetical protein